MHTGLQTIIPMYPTEDKTHLCCRLAKSISLYSELQKLHKKFVGNILQESEFWVTRKVKPTVHKYHLLEIIIYL